MGTKNRLSTVTVNSDPLLLNARSYNFYQIMSLLRQRFSSDADFCSHVRIRPNLGLAFTERDIQSLSIDSEGCYHLEINFFGLYGVTSPLPTFYTEDLLNEQLQGRDTSRAFLDIIHSVLCPLLYYAWKKNRFWMQTGEEERRKTALLLAFTGRTGTSFCWELIHYVGLFNQFPRSLLGLKQLLTLLLPGERVEVIPLVEKRVHIPPKARCLLGWQGCCLGQDSMVGMYTKNRSLFIDICIGPLSAALYHLLLPGADLFNLVRDLIGLYLNSSLSCCLNLSIRPEEQRALILGEDWTRLGLNTWTGDAIADNNVSFLLTAGHAPE